ncbi:hypothetical protein AB7004_21490, partial [Escherichia coli]|nr:hypothetical protein [Escherichia coli]MDA6466617.1 hypothetical protein [Escherichia coli]
DRNRSHWSTSKTPSYTKSVSWQHHPFHELNNLGVILDLRVVASDPSINIIDKINEQLIAN